MMIYMPIQLIQCKNNNWIDYIVPQLYWSIDHKTASYAKLIKWWSENVPSNTALYWETAITKSNPIQTNTGTINSKFRIKLILPVHILTCKEMDFLVPNGL